MSAAPLPQQPTPEDVNIPAVRVTTRMVLVDAVVTDKSGQRVKGLAKNDFTVLENGRPQQVAVFSFESRSQAAPSQHPALPENVYTNRPEYDMPSGPLTIMLLDGLNTPVADQGYARAQMLKYMGTQLQPGQPVAVYTLADSLRLLQDFTDDVRLLKAAAERFTPRESLELQREAVEKVLPTLNPAVVQNDPALRGGAGIASNNVSLVLQRMNDFMNEQVNFNIEIRAQRTMAALRLLARRVAGYSGRKNLVWVSAGFPIEKITRVVQFSTDRNSLTQQADAGFHAEKSFEEDLLRLAAELTDAQVSVYSIDARGLQTGGYSLTTENSQDTLLTLASQSGGLIFKNRNDVAGAVAVSVADGSAYYLLGYYPESKQWDGKFHKIQVKLNKPGLEVRHRTGYFAIDPNQFAKSKDKKNDPELNAAMSLGAPMATMVIFDSRVVPPAPASKMNVPIEFLVNPRTIAGEDMKNGGRHFIIEFHAAAYSAEGKLVAHKDTGIDAPIKADRLQAYLQQGIPFKTDVDLGPGQYRLRLAVRDGRTGYIGTTEIPLALAGK